MLAALFLLLTAVLGSSAPQIVFNDDLRVFSDDSAQIERDAQFIFNSVNSLLRQWGNTLSPNGFSFTVSSIPAGTTLFHARKDEHDPPSPEWLAFDSEMSYAIMGGRGGQTFMRTYRSTRALGPLLYIDGMSAALTATGSLDSQDILLYGYVTETRQFDEYTRAARLCEWGKPLGIEGFVRQNAGFELLWCDWSVGIELVLNNNVTHWLEDLNVTSPIGWPAPPDAPSDPVQFEIDLLAARHNASETDGLAPDEPPRPPGGPGSGFPRRRPYGGRYYGFNMSPFSAYSSWEWLRSATSVYSGVGEMRVQLAYSSFVTCYGRAGLSLPSRNPATHRLTNSSLTSGTAEQIRRDVAASVAAYSAGETSGIDWRAVTDQVVNRYGRRLPELHALVLNGTDSAMRQAKYLLSSLLIPSYVQSRTRPQNLDACSRAFTYGLEALVFSRERKILDAVTVVQREVCDVLLSLHEDLLSPTVGKRTKDPSQALLGLMARLDWHSWTKCDDECGWDQVCYIPIWPVMMGRRGGGGRPGESDPVASIKPVCLGYVDG